MKRSAVRSRPMPDREAVLKRTISVWEILPLIRDDCFMSLREAAKIVGLSKNTLFAARDLPKYQPSGEHGKVLVKKSELFKWIEKSRVQEFDLNSLCKKTLDEFKKKKPTSI